MGMKKRVLEMMANPTPLFQRFISWLTTMSQMHALATAPGVAFQEQFASEVHHQIQCIQKLIEVINNLAAGKDFSDKKIPELLTSIDSIFEKLTTFEAHASKLGFKSHE